MFNHFSPSSRSNLPLFSIGRLPVNMVTLLIGIHSLMMVLTTLLMSFGHTSWVNVLCYNSTAVWHGQILRLFTYAFINPPSVWFALEMMMLYYFGSELERSLGSKMFAILYAGLILLGSIFLQLLSLWGMPERMSGSQSVNFAIFAAFVAMYPGLPFLFGVPARWMLLAFMTLSSLQFLEAKQLTPMMIFLAESLGAIIFIIGQGYRELLPADSFSFLSTFLQRIISLRKIKKEAPSTRSTSSSLIGSCSTTTSFVPVFTAQPAPIKTAPPADVVMINIDALLEKISQTGMESLTAQEKEQLEKASNALLERDRTTKQLRVA